MCLLARLRACTKLAHQLPQVLLTDWRHRAQRGCAHVGGGDSAAVSDEWCKRGHAAWGCVHAMRDRAMVTDGWCMGARGVHAVYRGACPQARSGSGPRGVHAGAWVRARCSAGSARKQALNPRPLVHPFARSMAWHGTAWLQARQAAGHDPLAVRGSHAHGAGNAACTPLSRPHR
jgi:hypothetical protein